MKAKVNSILKKSAITRKDSEKILEITYKSKGQKQFRNIIGELEKRAYEELGKVEDTSGNLELLLRAVVQPLKRVEGSKTTTF